MNVIPDAGAVGRIVIVSEKRYRDTGANRAKQQWNEVSLRFVTLSRTPRRIGARGVEVAQTDASDAMNPIEPMQQLLNHHLRFAISADRRIGLRFHDRQ